jgi:hypothetical protein
MLISTRRSVRSAATRSDTVSANVISLVSVALIVLVPSSISEASSAGLVTFAAVASSMTDREARAIAEAGEIANVVKNSDCFRDFIAKRKLVGTRGRTADEVAEDLRHVSGSVPVEFYFRCLGAMGGCGTAVAYRLPPDPTVYINRAYYRVGAPDFDLYELAGSLAHEAIGHALGGYEHSFDWTPLRDFSVPYSISGASKENDDAFRHCRAPLGFLTAATGPG